MNTVAIIQARMGSSRLPGKVMLDLAGMPVLKVVVDRARAAKRVDKVVVATSLATADIAIERFCANEKINCFRGSEADVLDRVYQAAVTYRADHVVDITADCPLVDSRHIDKIVADLVGSGASMTSRNKQAYEGSPDYVSNCIERDWPDGLDIQAYTIATLEAAHGHPDAVREHVGWNIPHLAESLECVCKQSMAPARYRHPEWGLTLDEPADYELLRRVFTEAVIAYGNHLFPVEFVLEYLLQRPETMRINADVKRHANSNDKAAALIEEDGRG